MPDTPLTYGAAGVDIDAAQSSLRDVQAQIEATHGPEVVRGIGSFGGVFAANFSGNPHLVSSIDGVGTKTKVAAMMGDYSSLGYDIVNHCVNDILCQGAKPLFFLDYFGCARLSQNEFRQVVGGAANACAAVGCALIGGETAEMPGVYHDGEVDVVGAIVGLVDGANRLPRDETMAGDVVIGLASSGLHTNGYSLARKALFEVGGLSVRDTLETGEAIGEALLKPHKCYFNSVYPLIQEFPGIRGVAHITGGGLEDNLPRILPADLKAVLEKQSWNPPAIFRQIQSCGSVPDVEMYRAFNMGIGMVLVVERDLQLAVTERLISAGEHAAVIGEIQKGAREVQIL